MALECWIQCIEGCLREEHNVTGLIMRLMINQNVERLLADLRAIMKRLVGGCERVWKPRRNETEEVGG